MMVVVDFRFLSIDRTTVDGIPYLTFTIYTYKSFERVSDSF